MPSEVFDGPVTSKDELELEEEENLAGVNSEIYPPSRPESEPPDESSSMTPGMTARRTRSERDNTERSSPPRHGRSGAERMNVIDPTDLPSPEITRRLFR